MKIFNNISKFKKKEISFAFQNAKFFYSDENIKILISKAKLDFGKILLIFNRKTGNSPERNKIKRRARSIFFENKLFELKKNFILIGLKNIKNVSFDKLKTIFLSYKEKK